jgi:two-component system OmpR family response regulator
VDDEPVIRHLLAAYLASEGYAVGEAADGHEAQQKLLAAEWDLVITDRAMPNMGGEALAAWIKAERPCLRVIMMTGLAGQAQDAAGSSGPIRHVLKKPFLMAELVDAIELASGALCGAGR